MRILILLVLHNTLAQLKSCDEDISELTLCYVDENGYDLSGPSKPFPSKLTPSIEIHDVVEFNAEEKSLSLLLEIHLEWNDTRLFLKSGDPNK